MPGLDNTERFVQQLTGCQTRLLAFIAMLLGDPTAANDVLQETNLVLWRKSAEFEEGRDFAAWACSIARFQVLAYLRDAKRDRHLFNDALVDTLVDHAGPAAADLEDRHRALTHCLEKLSPEQRGLVQGRYALDETIQQLASRTGRTSGSVAMSLSRIRQMLLECIRCRLAAETGP